MSKGPWIDRDKLIARAKKFVGKHGYFFRENADRISSLVEIAVYNSIVQYYESQGFFIAGQNLGPKSSFKYKVTATGLAENYSYFTATKEDVSYHILHNIRIQSAHDEHLYFTADVVVTNDQGATTQTLQSGRRHSFVSNPDMLTFAEVKHLNPFPEALFNFMGLILEFMPKFVAKEYEISTEGHQLSPIIAFTGVASEHAERIQESLTTRYGINIVFGTSETFGKLTGYGAMNKYSTKVPTPPPKPVVLKRTGSHKRRIDFGLL